MSSKRKGEYYETGHLEWSEFERLEKCLLQDGNYPLFAAVSLGVRFALRASDILSLKWNVITDSNGDPVDSFEMFEKKTEGRKNKPRAFTVSDKSKQSILLLREKTNPQLLRKYVVSDGLHHHFKMTWLNSSLKKAFRKYGIRYNANISSHLMRKTYGRRYWHKNNFSEKSIVILMHTFCHTDIATTMRYLGITQTEAARSYVMID